jgi:anaerobic magnesium-protoporphyrin IX monomethyl ester cyclase
MGSAVPTKKCLSVLLVYPPSRSQAHESCPWGLMMLGAALERAGHAVRLLDANACRKTLNSAQIVKYAASLKPDVIGITLVTPIVREAYQLANALRSTGAKLLAGGPHATILPEEALANGFDAVVIGEGEPAVEDAVRALTGRLSMEKVIGWAYRDAQGRICRTEPRAPLADLDALPPPARHLVDASDYGGEQNPRLHSTLFTSRGCPAKCAYCSGGLFGRRFRFRSAHSIVDEMAAVHRRYGTRHFHFMDDAMTVNRERVHEICTRISECGLGLTWSMMTRVDFVDEDLLAVLARGGCVQIDYGIESGHPETLRRIHKPHTVEMVRRIVPLTAAYGIKPYAFFILGFPWDTPESIQATKALMEELSPYVANFHPAIASILIPFPGTEVYERYKDDHGFENWWLGSDRSYDAPDGKSHPYFETQLYSRGAVLDADFFSYTPEVKHRIREVFEFMWRHNLRGSGRATRLLKSTCFEISRKLSAVSPTLERLVLAPVRMAHRFSRHA